MTFLNHARTNMSNSRDRKNAGNAAKIAKLISLALRIWLSSSIALFEKINFRNLKNKTTRLVQLKKCDNFQGKKMLI